MKLRNLFLLILVFRLRFFNCLDSETEASSKCTLINKEAAKPQPSLVQCYRNNANSCCNSMADSIIESAYSTLLSSACIRKFPDLESYFCYGCNQAEYLYTNHQNKSIIICKSFVQAIWGQEDINKPTTKFDQCGMCAYWDKEQLILPSEQWNSALEFLEEVKPPLFENYTIVISDQDCFESAIQQNQKSLYMLALLAILLYFGI